MGGQGVSIGTAVSLWGGRDGGRSLSVLGGSQIADGGDEGNGHCQSRGNTRNKTMGQFRGMGPKKVMNPSIMGKWMSKKVRVGAMER
jgi:hypothetical protein